MKILLALITGLALGAVAARNSWAEELKAGDEAPAFSLVGTDDKTYTLEDYKDKQVVIVAWFPKAKTGG